MGSDSWWHDAENDGTGAPITLAQLREMVDAATRKGAPDLAWIPGVGLVFRDSDSDQWKPAHEQSP